MDAPVKDPEEGGAQEGLTGGHVLVGGNVCGEMSCPEAVAFEEEGVNNGDKEDGSEEVAELVVVPLRGGGGETTLPANFFRLPVGEARAFGCGEVELDVRLGRGGVRHELLGEARQADRIGVDELS